MEAGIVGQGVDDVGGISGKPGQLINHHVRCCRRDRIAHRLRIEGIGSRDRSAKLTQTIHPRAGARHAIHLMTERAQGAYEWRPTAPVAPATNILMMNSIAAY